MSLFDHSGVWSQNYLDNDYEVIRVDIKRPELPNNIFDISSEYLDSIGPVYGILAAPPCTNTALAGARWFAEKDKDGRTEEAIKIFNKTLEIIKYCKPKFWALEQPISRLVTLIPEFKQYFKGYFQPFWYGENYSKKTAIFGNCIIPPPTNIIKPEGMRPGQPPEWYSKVGGSSEKTKEYRSKTSEKFALAFFENNR